MKRGAFSRAAACAVAASALALGPALLGCPSQTQEMNDGDAVDAEEAVPVDPNAMKMTEEERRQQEMLEEQNTEREEFDASGQGDNAPQMP